MNNKLIKWTTSFFRRIRRALGHISIKSKYNYKIVDFIHETNMVTLQCCATRAFFFKNLKNIIADQVILDNLEPEQACFLGIIAGEKMQQGKLEINTHTYNHLSLPLYNIQDSDSPVVFDRYDNVIFIDPISQQKQVVRPKKIAATKNFVNLFNPVVAYTIGVKVGIEYNSNHHIGIVKRANGFKLIKVGSN